MQIAIASGKGGTGKTTVAVNLALSLSGAGERLFFLDCDVEAPNAALFLQPTLTEHRDVGQQVPRVDPARCTACGRCAEVCQYHAITVIGQQVLVFPELCHGCGSCTLNCPTGAISEVFDKTGVLERGQAGAITFGQGVLDIGEAQAVPVIRQLKQWVAPSDDEAAIVLLDAPPGASCPVVETLRDADMVLLVTEPTPFGLHDLRVAVEVARDELGLPVAVVINRDGMGDAGVETYCAAEGIPVVLRIPFRRAIAEAYADGIPLIEAQPAYRVAFRDLYTTLAQLATAGKNRQPASGGVA
ncbi:MAG: ATP-binding protein [Anaerolineae bacterium]|nr:ATP-binding protein [Anaerolineae bacterium]